ncbi:MAG: energy-coupling factor transporter transmembrane component T, partial [Candidatus Limnocylindria bacterium]
VSPRFAIGALAALRQLPLLAREWEIIGMARRARGVDGGRSPVAAIRLLASRVFGLLVSAIRRGSRLALAMEARGFGAAPCRTVARPRRMRPSDWVWIVGAAGLGGGAIAISVALGTWRPLIG